MPTFNYELKKSLAISLSSLVNLYGRSGYAVGLSAISLLAKFSSRSKKSVPKSQSHFPSPNPVPLAKDAASIPNALAMSNEVRAMNKVAESVEVMMINFAFLCEKWAAGNEQGR